MKVQRLIEKYKKLEGVWNAEGAELARQIFLQDLEQLDEPEKVKVSEEEAKFLKTFNFSHDSDVTKALYYVSRTGFCYYLTDNFDIELKGLSEGFRDLENRKRLIRAILDGYEVEEEKRYFVKITAAEQYLVRVEDENFLGFLQSRLKSKFTRKELEEAGFGWVFDCPGIEVEEVEG
ncbi:DUF1642 domain-containing protein [Streptococcus mitis]|uniref:DUF1642 domain-containing protein n=1 Tax=Streptococcus mitis TaxID=28037 RepID=UPI0020018E46|nr:DUF1642 domain-containing protein [Streptococcus mitis]